MARELWVNVGAAGECCSGSGNAPEGGAAVAVCAGDPAASAGRGQ